jgi:hypothetical protein
VPVAQEPLHAPAPREFGRDLVARALGEVVVVDREGGEPDGAQERRVDLLRRRLARQHRLEHHPGARDVVGHDVDDRPLGTVGAEEVEPVERLERRLGERDRGGVELGATVVGLVAALPDPVVGGPVRAADVVDEVLHEADLGLALHDR